MSPSRREDDWDFTPVIDLIYSLSVREDTYTHKDPADCSTSLPKKSIFSENENGFEQNAQLGNFDKIWQYLGQPLDLLPPKVSSVPVQGSVISLTENDFVEQCSLKEVRWRDEVEGANLADNDANDDSCDPEGLKNNQGKKNQRKAAKRKQRRGERSEALINGRVLPSGSEDESGKDIKASQVLDRQAIIYKILHGVSEPETATSCLRSGKIFKSDSVRDSKAVAKQAVQILKTKRESTLEVAAARRAELIATLTETFIDERQYLSNVSLVQNASTNTNVAGDGIHVFVDASNVSYGSIYKSCVLLLTSLTR